MVFETIPKNQMHCSSHFRCFRNIKSARRRLIQMFLKYLGGRRRLIQMFLKYLGARRRSNNIEAVSKFGKHMKIWKTYENLSTMLGKSFPLLTSWWHWNFLWCHFGCLPISTSGHLSQACKSQSHAWNPLNCSPCASWFCLNFFGEHFSPFTILTPQLLDISTFHLQHFQSLGNFIRMRTKNIPSSAECDVPVPGIPVPGNYSLFLMVSEPVSKKFGTEKCLGIGPEKIWYRKKSRNQYWKMFVPELIFVAKI